MLVKRRYIRGMMKNRDVFREKLASKCVLLLFSLACVRSANDPPVSPTYVRPDITSTTA